MSQLDKAYVYEYMILLSVLTNCKKVFVAKVDKKGGHWNKISSVISNNIYTEKSIYWYKCFQSQSTATSICHSDTCELQFSFGLSAG